MIKENRKKIIFFLPPNIGGAERITITYAKLLDTNLYDIKFVVIGKEKGDIVKFIPCEFETLFINIRTIYHFATLKIYKLLKKERPDIVFCSLIRLNTRVIAAAKLHKNIKVIVRNNIGLFEIKTLINRFLVNLLYPKSDKIVLQTEEMLDECKKWFKNDLNKFIVIPNPIDKATIDNNVKEKTSPLDPNCCNFVFVGRISYVKGLDILIRAFKKVSREIENAKLYIVGKIEQEEYYKSLLHIVEINKLTGKVIFTGFSTNPHIYIKNANSLVLPSRIEGMPNVVLDAMYLKTPVVVTRSVPIVEELVDSKHGITVPVDDIEAMSNAMIRILEINVKESYTNNSEELVKQIFSEVLN